MSSSTYFLAQASYSIGFEADSPAGHLLGVPAVAGHVVEDLLPGAGGQPGSA